MATEKQLDLALEQGIRSDSKFRTWFLSQTRTGSKFPTLVTIRANNPWGKVRMVLPNSTTGALEATRRESETDVLAIFESSNGQRLAFHIENKLANGSFTPYQPDMYAARAEAWRQIPKYGNYDEWETVLIAPASFVQGKQAEVAKFMSFISHESIAPHLPAFGAADA